MPDGNCEKCELPEIDRGLDACEECFRVNSKATQKTCLNCSTGFAGSATLTGFTVEEIQKMVEAIYGSCVWERVKQTLSNDFVVCYPTSTGKVVVFGK